MPTRFGVQHRICFVFCEKGKGARLKLAWKEIYVSLTLIAL